MSVPATGESKLMGPSTKHRLSGAKEVMRTNDFHFKGLTAKPCPWSRKESDITEQLSTHIQQNSKILGEAP